MHTNLWTHNCWFEGFECICIRKERQQFIYRVWTVIEGYSGSVAGYSIDGVPLNLSEKDFRF